MPAIDLTKLRTQVKELLNHFTDPALFLHSFKELLGYYRNHTLKADIKNNSGITSFNSPRQVISAIEIELAKSAINNPHSALDLTHHLWNESFLEAKLLAIYLLQVIPKDLALPLLSRFPEMFQEIQRNAGILPLMINAMIQLRKEFPQRFMDMVSSWLAAPGMYTRGWGIKILTGLVEKQDYEDLPMIFEVFKPILLTADHTLHMDLVDCINSLYDASPAETILFLKDSIGEINEPTILQAITRITRDFPNELKKEITPLVKSRLLPEAKGREY